LQKARSLRGRWVAYCAPLIPASLVLLVDQVTKVVVRGNLAEGESVPQEGFLRITHLTNSGIIFGLDAPLAVSLVLPLLVLGMALFLYFRYGPFDGWLVNAAVALFVGGSLGNLLDRLILGHVTDFFDVRLWGGYHWPAFNVADVGILLGAILFIVFVFKLRSGRATGHL
jgi:signal peptidase II